MTKKMKPKIKAQWVAALRSGDYKQGIRRLRSAEDDFCCLGVLCNLHAQAHPEIAAKQSTKMSYMGRDALPHTDVYMWAGLSINAELTIGNLRGYSPEYMNDQGKTFAQIADAIEAQL